MRPEFTPFPKLSRFNREVIVTEKIDGTNAQIVISDDGTNLWAASRSKYVTPEDDNHGFARWAYGNADELLKLGPGSHFGEWWGRGVNKRYPGKEKTFSLFNTSRWGGNAIRPTCCDVVPVLWTGKMIDFDAFMCLHYLEANGSVADPTCKNPEGIVIYHVPSKTLFKMTLDKNDEHKGTS